MRWLQLSLIWISVFGFNSTLAAETAKQHAVSTTVSKRPENGAKGTVVPRWLGPLDRAYGKFQARQYPEAYSLCNQALEIDPGNIRAMLLKAHIDVESGRVQQAVREFDQIRAVHPDELCYWDCQQAASANVDVGHLQTALEYYNIAVQKSPNDPQLYRERARLECALHLSDKAQKDFDTQIKLQKNPKNYVARGDFFMQEKRYRDAVKDYSEAIRLDPSWSVAFGCRSRAYAKLGETKLASLDKDQAMQLGGTFDDPNLYQPSR